MNYPWPADSQGLQVGDLLVDLRYRRVVTAEGSIELQQRVFELLLALMAEPNKLFTRSELFDRLWSGLVVDDANLSQSIWLLRKALGEPRREWIRTVAKRGYVFQPPGAVEWFRAMPSFAEDGAVVRPGAAVVRAPEPLANREADVAPNDYGRGLEGVGASEGPTVPVPQPPALVPSVAPVVRRIRLGHWMALAVAAVLSVAAALWLLPASVPKTATIALMPVHDEAGTDAPWASSLLRHWLGWKLGQLPDVHVVSGEELAAGQGVERPAIVLLSSTRTPDGKGVTVRARVQRDGREYVFEESAPATGVPALVDRLSAQLMGSLLPGRQDAWPALEVDAEAARAYLPAGAAFARGDWQEVEALAPAVLTRAPRFGLMHFQLGLAQHHLGESAHATRQLEIASRLLTPMPDDARASLDALKLEVDPRRAREAEQALRALVLAHPDHAPYLDRYIGLLIGTGQYERALSEIARSKAVGTDTPSRRFRRELQYADVYYALGQTDRSRRHAQAAQALAEGDGEVPQARRAAAALIEARAIATDSPQRGVEAYRRASRLLAATGSAGAAEYADILADVYASKIGSDSAPLAAALNRARQAGALGLEADILISLANTSVREEERLEWLRQALKTAQDMGNLNLQGELESEFAWDDLMHLRLPEARARATQLQALTLEGVAGIRVNSILSRVYELQGLLEDALKANQLALRSVPANADTPNSDHAAASCNALRLYAHLGTRAKDGSLSQGCARGGDGPSNFDAAWTQGYVALLQGRSQEATTHIKATLDLLQGGQATAAPHHPQARAAARLRLAYLLVRAGDSVTADVLAGQVQQEVDAQSLPPLQRALLAVLQAEIHAAQGDWEGSRERAKLARAQIPAEARELLDRLDLLQIADDQRRGESAKAIAGATALYARAGQRHDLRTQQLVLSLVPTRSLGLAGDAVQAAEEGHKQLPGATMAWLGSADHGDPGPVRLPVVSRR